MKMLKKNNYTYINNISTDCKNKALYNIYLFLGNQHIHSYNYNNNIYYIY